MDELTLAEIIKYLKGNESNLPINLGEDMNPAAKMTAFPTKSLEGKTTDNIGGLGMLLQQFSSTDYDNLGMSTVGGALQGLSAGAAFGPIGMIGGALLGGGFGYQSAANNKIAKLLKDKLNLSSKTVQPSIGDFGTGGFIINDMEFVPVQMEKDEVYLAPNLNIYDSKADKTHEQMADDEVTDVVPSSSFAFSNRKEFKPNNLKDIILGRGFAYYKENDYYELEDVKFNDLFKDVKGDISFADAAKIIRKKIKVKDEENPDIFTEITDQENKQSRMPYLMKLMELHNGGEGLSSESKIPIQKFGSGGSVITPYQSLPEWIIMLNKMNAKKIGNTSKSPLGADVDKAFDNFLNNLSEQEKEVLGQFDASIKDSANIFKGMKRDNLLSALGRFGALSAMNTDIEPMQASGNFADEMFQGVSPALEDAQISENYQRVNSLLSKFSETNPGLANKLAPRLMDSALSASNKVASGTSAYNLTQDQKRYAFLNNLDNVNRKARLEAEKATEQLLNEKRMGLANTLTNYLSANSAIAANELNTKNILLGQKVSTQMGFNNAELGATLGKSQFDMQLERLNQQIDSLRNALINKNKNSSTPPSNPSPDNGNKNSSTPPSNPSPYNGNKNPWNWDNPNDYPW